jgi:RHS repeat-associated protein
VSPQSLSYTAFGELVVLSGGNWVVGGPLGDGSAGAPAGYPRYQYCGVWGYEAGRDPIDMDGSGLPARIAAICESEDLLSLAGANPTLPRVRLLHVGARWYDPAIGRFVQRDPLGISSGLNTYAYPLPTSTPDPTGMSPWGDDVRNQALVGVGLAGIVGAAGWACIIHGQMTRDPRYILSGVALVQSTRILFLHAMGMFAYANVLDQMWELSR